MAPGPARGARDLASGRTMLVAAATTTTGRWYRSRCRGTKGFEWAKAWWVREWGAACSGCDAVVCARGLEVVAGFGGSSSSIEGSASCGEENVSGCGQWSVDQ